MSRLKLGILRDENFKVGNHVIKMVRVGTAEFTLEVQGAMNQRFDIGSTPVEVVPGVTITASKSEIYSPQGTVRKIMRAVVVIEAPKDVIIHRFKGEERFA